MRQFLIGAAALGIGMLLLLLPVAVGCGVLQKDHAVWGIAFPAEGDLAKSGDIADGAKCGKNSAEPPGMPEKKKIALTFDDGPNPEYTKKLLDGLAKRHVKVTFFVLGERASWYPELVKREAEEGHLIGSHTYRHEQLNKLPATEAYETIFKAADVISSITGKEVDFIRPPYGEWDKTLETKLNMIPIFWTVDPRDWDSTDVDEIVENVVTNVKENDIILMHDDYQTSVDAAFRIIDILTEQGYEFVTVDELVIN